MRSCRYFHLLLALLGFGVFTATSHWSGQAPAQILPAVEGRVVIVAPVVLVLYGGDRFLAASMETMRLAATSVEQGQVDTDYLIRAQRVVAELNPCHEDNYYLANGLLTWGGADRESDFILRRAMDCRSWDDIPAFFYGFNQSFFHKNLAEARRALELAAQRSPVNAAVFRKLAVMLQAESFADERLALDYMLQQRDAASDPKLRDMLDKRVTRLQGLVTLREAQRRFEAENGALTSLDQLVEHGVLLALPVDPLRLGYELKNGRIILKKMKVAGMEDQP